MRRCLLLFSRDPAAEARSKRLPGSEPLFALTLERVARAAREAGFDLVVVGPAARSLAGAAALPQRGASFRDRLGHAFGDARALGYGQIVAVPGDVPGLDARALRAAARALDGAPVVTGPSPDGGIYLLGLAGAPLALLEGVRWRTPAVFGDVCAGTRSRGLALAVLPPLADVDRAGDLDALSRDAALDAALRRLIRAIRRPAPPIAIAREKRSYLLDPAAPAPVRGPPALAG